MIETNFDCPGWSTAVDPRTGRQYFINLTEKTTTWEDPRSKYKPIHISMQPLHGSPKNVQIYPTQNYPVQAFQSHSGQSVNASPIPSTKTTSQYSHHTVEMSSLSRSSPQTPRVGSLLKNHHQQQTMTQETSFSSQTAVDTEATVAKINTMFPTASEHHIRLLLKKFHNREAVVISALQVEKHPLTTPGPYTPPVQRSFHATAMALSAFNTPPSSSFGRKNVQLLHGDHLTITSSSNGSPIPNRPHSQSSFYTTATTATAMTYGSPSYNEQYRSSPKPLASPKMKLRYLKSMFPKAEETVILDVLASVENNVQKASDQLKGMGYEKKEMTPAPRLSHRKKEEHQPKKEVHIEPTPPPKPKTSEEKKKLKQRLQSQYKDMIPEKVILMALESVDYSEDKALKILDIVLQEDKDMKKKSEKDSKKSDVEKNICFREPSNLEKDELMIINSDHSIITTPIEDNRANLIGVSQGQEKLEAKIDDTPSSETSCSDVQSTANKEKKQRTKSRNESNRSEKHISFKTGETKNKSNAKTVMFEDTRNENFMSIITSSTRAKGPDPGLSCGPRDNLLLTDYVAWNGANPDMLRGNKCKTSGPNSALRNDRAYTPRGRNTELCKGPQIGLSKGGIYSQINRTNVIGCN